MDTDVPPPSHAPRPPLWRPRPSGPPSLLVIAISGFVAVALAAWFVVALWEDIFFSSPAVPAVVRIAAVEKLGHASEEGRVGVRYRVTLPDGTAAPLVTPNLHQVGDRLRAMVSRGRVTGRTFVTAPYVMLPKDRATEKGKP